MLAALFEDPSSILSMHIWWLTKTCNSNSRKSNAPFWPSRAPGRHRHTSIIVEGDLFVLLLHEHQRSQALVRGWGPHSAGGVDH